MRKRIIFIISFALLFLLTMRFSVMAEENNNLSYSQPPGINSHGVFRVDGNNDGDYTDSEDVVFDAMDIYYLYSICQ